MSKSKTKNVNRSDSEGARRTICGVIRSSSEDYKLEHDDMIIVSLCDITHWDITRADFPHIPNLKVVEHLFIDGYDYFPIPFTLYYNAESIDENLSYGIQCDVLDTAKQVKYRSESIIPVLTDNHPKTNIILVVDPHSFLLKTQEEKRNNRHF